MTASTAAILSFHPRVTALERMIQEAASGNVAIATRLFPTLEDREVTTLQVSRSLRRAVVVGDVQVGESGGWVCSVVDPARRTVEIASITVQLANGRLWVSSIQWDAKYD